MTRHHDEKVVGLVAGRWVFARVGGFGGSLDVCPVRGLDGSPGFLTEMVKGVIEFIPIV